MSSDWWRNSVLSFQKFVVLLLMVRVYSYLLFWYAIIFSYFPLIEDKVHVCFVTLKSCYINIMVSHITGSSIGFKQAVQANHNENIKVSHIFFCEWKLPLAVVLPSQKAINAESHIMFWFYNDSFLMLQQIIVLRDHRLISMLRKCLHGKLIQYWFLGLFKVNITHQRKKCGSF